MVGPFQDCHPPARISWPAERPDSRETASQSAKVLQNDVGHVVVTGGPRVGRPSNTLAQPVDVLRIDASQDRRVDCIEVVADARHQMGLDGDAPLVRSALGRPVDRGVANQRNGWGVVGIWPPESSPGPPGAFREPVDYGRRSRVLIGQMLELAPIGGKRQVADNL